MPKPERIRRQQHLRQAEGYLGLCLVGEPITKLANSLRDRMVELGLQCLEGVEESTGLRGQAFGLRGQLLRAGEQYEEAVHWLQKATDLLPEDIDLYLALGWCYKRLGRLDLAIESLERASDLEDPTGIVLYNLACYWALAGHVKVAVNYLGRAFEVSPQLRDLVPSETDFDPIREEPDFLAVTAVIV